MMFYFEKLPDCPCYIHLWLTIDAHVFLYLENNTVFMTVLSCAFAVFICHTLVVFP